MNLKERIQTVLQKLNLLDKAKANQLTQEEWGQIVNSYNQEYQSILQDDLAADQAAQRYSPFLDVSSIRYKPIQQPRKRETAGMDRCRPFHSQPTVKVWCNWPLLCRAWLTI